MKERVIEYYISLGSKGELLLMVFVIWISTILCGWLRGDGNHIVEALGIEPIGERRHTALGDAELTWEVYRGLQKLINPEDI